MLDLEAIKAEFEEARQHTGWYAFFDREHIPALIAEIERLHKVMDLCAAELSGTMEYGGVLGALRDREVDPLDG